MIISGFSWFLAGEGGWANDVSVPRKVTPSFWIVSFEFVKVCGTRFSIWESFIGFYDPSLVSTILACLFSVGVRISWKKLCWMRAWRRRWHLLSPTLYIIIVYRVNLNKLSRNFVGALRTTTTNCRVSFIDLYLVFPRNFRIVFLPHTNTYFTGTRTVALSQPGLPVMDVVDKWRLINNKVTFARQSRHDRYSASFKTVFSFVG